MQNSTLRKKGKFLFLFAFLLMNATYSYGQTCPVVDDQNDSTAANEQYFCDSQIPEIQHLSATGSDIAWYSDQTSTTPLASTQLLVDGETYYAGTSTGSCAGSRESVTVTVYSQPDILGIKEDTKQSLSTLYFCVADEANSGIYLDIIRTSADGNDIQWYPSQESTTVLDPATTELVDGATYWVDQGNPYGTCRSNRRSVRIILNSEPAPTGESAQTFCAANNPTLADIVTSSSDNRYFLTETSEIELGSSTPLEDGETYFIAAVGTECVSVERLAVTVTVSDLTITEERQGFCETESATVADLLPADGTWYADTTFTTPLDPTTALEHAGEYYLEIAPGTCTTTKVVADIYPAPDAGNDTAVTLCSNDAPINLFDQIDGTPDPAGTFEPALTDNLFDPAQWGAGEHTFTYTVEGNDFCADAVSTITVTVNEAPDAGEDVTATYCSSDLADGDALLAEFDTFMEGRDLTGTFSPTLETLRDDFNANPVGTFSTTYTVTDSETGCTDSANFSVTVNQTPDAGTDATVQLIEGDMTVIDLFAELGGSPATGGEWTNEEGTVVSGTFDPAVDTAPATYTYTVTVDGCTATATVFVAEACPIVADTTPEFCEVIDDGTGLAFPTVGDLAPSHATWYTSADPEDDTVVDPATELEDGAVYYAGNASGTCTARTAVTVTILDSPNAGVDTAVNVCANDPAFDLVSYIDASIMGDPDTSGTFSPALASGGTMFDPAVDAGGTYTYTVASNTSCPDATATVTVTVETVPNAPTSTTGIPNGCQSEGLTVADLSATAETGNTIQWYTDAALTTPAAETDVLVTGTYYATQINAAGCESSTATPADVVINDAPTPSLSEGGNMFCMIDQPVLGDIAMNESNITWYDQATGGNVVSENEPLLDGDIYYASLTDTTSGCESSQRLAVTAVVEKCALPIPEAFSPNNDGINDLFIVDFIGEQYPNFTIEIFNRWGQTVFKGNASNAAWDGASSESSLGSDVLPAGVYFYVIEYNDGETAPAQGRLYLSR